MNSLSSGRSSMSDSHSPSGRSLSSNPHSAFHSHASGLGLPAGVVSVGVSPVGGENEETSCPVWRSIARIEVDLEPIKTWECS